MACRLRLTVWHTSESEYSIIRSLKAMRCSTFWEMSSNPTSRERQPDVLEADAEVACTRLYIFIVIEVVNFIVVERQLMFEDDGDGCESSSARRELDVEPQVGWSPHVGENGLKSYDTETRFSTTDSARRWDCHPTLYGGLASSRM